MTIKTETVPNILTEYMQSSGNNTYRKLAGLLNNNTGYPTFATIGNWMNGGTPDKIKLEVILTRVETEEARELVRALLAAVELEE